MIDQIRKLAVEALKVDFPSAVDGTQFTVGYVRGFIAGRTSVTREQVVRVLADNGLSGIGELHHWRCEYTEVYGECKCVAGLVDDLLALLNGDTDD